MITIKIGSTERPYADAPAQWISEQIRRRREQGSPVFLTVTLNKGSINLVLTDPPHPGRPRPYANQQCREISAMWTTLITQKKDFMGASLIAFLQHVKALA